MNVLFIANVELNENEGIYKKIVAQAKGLKNANGDGWLLTKKGNGARVFDFRKENSELTELSVFSKARELIKGNDIRLVYIRHMIPSPALISLLRWMKKRGIRVFYEIPTYPYYAEQFRVSKRKLRAIGKLAIDTVFWPFIYSNISKLVVIKSNSNVKMYKKMVEITNGADVNSIESKKYSAGLADKLSMVAVGTLYPYHGYDRILEGLKEYGKKSGAVPVEFHIVGASQTIDELRETAGRMGLDNVFFHGVKNTGELNEMYRQFDIGVGSVALHRRNADIDTTIKVIEYYCRGVVVVTSGISPMDRYDPGVTIHAPDDETPIDIASIVEQYQNIPRDKIEGISGLAKQKFSWDSIMKSLCD